MDRNRQDLARLRLGLLASLHFDQARAAAGFSAHLLLDALQQQAARFVAGQRRDAFDGSDLLQAQTLDLSKTRFGLLLALLQLALAIFVVLHLSIEVFFLLSQPPLLRLELDAVMSGVLLGCRKDADRVLLGFQQDGFLFRVGGCARFGGVFFGNSTLVDGHTPFACVAQCVAQPSADCAAGN